MAVDFWSTGGLVAEVLVKVMATRGGSFSQPIGVSPEGEKSDG